MSLPQGHQEVTYSQSERIGLANWSAVNVLISAKVVVPYEQVNETWDFLHHLVQAYTQETTEKVMIEMGLYAGAVGSLQSYTEEQKVALATSAQYDSIELVFSQQETIGLPEKSSAQYMASSKMATAKGTELQMLRYLSDNVARQLAEKREAISRNIRPWTASKG